MNKPTDKGGLSGRSPLRPDMLRPEIVPRGARPSEPRAPAVVPPAPAVPQTPAVPPAIPAARAPIEPRIPAADLRVPAEPPAPPVQAPQSFAAPQAFASLSLQGPNPDVNANVPPPSGRPAGAEDQPPVEQQAPVDPHRMTPRSPRAALEPERVTVPARSKSARHPIIVVGNAIFTIVLLLAVVLGGTVWWGKERFEEAGPLQENKIVNIPRGYGVRDIADLLVREGVIDQPYVFVAGAMALKSRGEELKAGEYEFQKHASMRDVAATIGDGKVVLHQITIPEGLTSEQIVAKLLESDILTGAVKEIPREGTLLPESYKFARGTTREQIIQHMQQAQRRALQEIWERRTPDLPIKTPEQLVTLASIVEKETGKAEERTRVASVFHNRLKTNMRLQSDPTIIYGLVGGKGSLGRPIMRSEIEQPTPYNTYVINGLPPGPIANPGRASLEAVANPARTKELYFVADGTGGHAFAENYEQHQRNVAKLRAIEQGANAGKETALPLAPAETVPSPIQLPPAAAPRASRRGAPARNGSTPRQP